MGFLLAPTNFYFSYLMCLIYDFTIKSDKSEKRHTTFFKQSKYLFKRNEKDKMFCKLIKYHY